MILAGAEPRVKIGSKFFDRTQPKYKLLKMGALHMGIRIGVIEYNRPSRPIYADDIRQILAVGGKDIVRMAWASLNPDRDNEIKRDALANWLCELFNLKNDCQQGYKCIWILCNMDILYERNGWVGTNINI